MAFGFPASYTVRRELFGSRQTAREAVMYTFELLRWEYVALDVDRFRATIRMSGASWGEQLYVSLAEGEIEIRSVCSLPQLFDWGKNKHNVDEFLSHFVAKEFREVVAPHDEPHFIDDTGATPVDRLFSAEQEDSADRSESGDS